MSATPTITPETVVDEATDLDHPWSIRLYDDPVNLADFVAMALSETLDIPTDVAWKHVRTVEKQGSAIVFDGPRTKAEPHALALTSFGLHVKMEKSS